MGQSTKEYLAASGKWGFLLTALLIGDVVGIVQSYNTNFVLPQWAWWLILVGILILSPFIAFHKLRLKRDDLQNRLEAINNARPNIIFTGTKNIQAIIRDVGTGVILGEPVFSQVLFANDPLTPLQSVAATNVAGHIDVYAQNGTHLFQMIGRWSETKEEALGAKPTEMEQIVIPANGRPNPMDVVLKYREDEDCYGHSNEGRRLATIDWRDMQKRLSAGIYLVKVRLRGSPHVDKEFWFNLVNKGSGMDVELRVSASSPHGTNPLSSI